MAALFKKAITIARNATPAVPSPAREESGKNGSKPKAANYSGIMLRAQMRGTRGGTVAAESAHRDANFIYRFPNWNAGARAGMARGAGKEPLR